MIYTKSLSPLIATILLIVVSVALIGIVVSWGKGFTTENLNTSEKIKIYSESDVSFYVNVISSINGRTVIEYKPPVNTSFKDLNIIGYGLSGYTNQMTPLEPTILLNVNRSANIDHGIILSKFDFVLYLDDGKIITKKNISQEIKQPFSCKQGYIPVPGNYLYQTMNSSGGFCVMKYHAKMDQNNDGLGDENSSCALSTFNLWANHVAGCQVDNINRKLVSTPEGWIIYGFNLYNARVACEQLGEHLMTNDEYMTLARNIELVKENWTEGEVGFGKLYRGHTDNSPEYALIASYDDSNGFYLTDSNDFTDQRRTYFLNNNQVIWDLSGNSVTLVDYFGFNRVDSPDAITVSTGNLFVGGTWIEFTGEYTGRTLSSLGSFKYKDLMLLNIEKMHSNYNSGFLYILSGYTNPDVNLSIRRSGNGWAGVGGLLDVGVNQPATNNMSSIRCTYVP